MLQSLLPKAHHKFEALPLLGPVIDGFDDWLAANGYTPGSRKFAVRTLIHADTDLRGRGVRDIHKLSRATLYDSWRDLIEVFPNNAGTVRTLARYLTLRAKIDETVLLVLITEQGENRNQCEEQRNIFGFSHGFACR